MIRIGNCSGFYGDRLAAMREMLEGGPLDVLTGDYLAELTMLILARDRLRDPTAGYARTFLRQLEDCLGLAMDRGVKIVVNAGGLNPAGLAEAVGTLAGVLGVPTRVGHVLGDELPADGGVANAYLGCRGIVECLRGGADVVVTGRVTDASLLVGPAAWHHDWAPRRLGRAGRRDRGRARAGVRRPGHRRQLRVLPRARRPAAPRLPDRRGRGRRLGGDHQASRHRRRGDRGDRHRAAALRDRPGRVRRAGRGVPVRHDPASTRSARTGSGCPGWSARRRRPSSRSAPCGWPASATRPRSCSPGWTSRRRPSWSRTQVEQALAGGRPERLEWTLARTDHPDADTEEAASALLHLSVQDPDQDTVGRAFSRVPIELALASYPGFHVTAPPARRQPVRGVHGLVRCRSPMWTTSRCCRTAAGSRCRRRRPGRRCRSGAVLAGRRSPSGPTRRVPLGTIAGARSRRQGRPAPTSGSGSAPSAAYGWFSRWLTAGPAARAAARGGRAELVRRASCRTCGR